MFIIYMSVSTEIKVYSNHEVNFKKSKENCKIHYLDGFYLVYVIQHIF